ncbi:MAG: hypothetical protein QOI84_1425 [Solirubrobacterales bacterium]|nr:hypothetical protein [Solirubrobacterales bacterium]
MMTGELVLLLAEHLLLTGLPGAAAALFAARNGVRSVPVLLAIFLAASGGVGFLGFWAYYGDRVLGESLSYFVLIGSVALIAWSLHGGLLDRALLRRLGTPLALWGLGSVFLVMLGFVHGGTAEPIITSTTRFSHPLPTDSTIPLFYTEWFFHNGHHGVPPIFPGEWLVSDRPPLQIGYALSQRPFAWDARGLSYQVLGVVLQQLWIVGLWALLLAARVGRVTRGLAMVAVLVSDLAIVSGFFVWPKLLPAAMLLAATGLVMTPLWDEVRTRLWGAALDAALCGLAMLGHGSSAFGIIPLVLLAAYRGLPSWRWIGVGLAVGIVLLGSWAAFQKYADPPGNRVTKWTLAGVVEIDGRGTLESIRDAYAEAGVGGTLHNKAENFVTMVGGAPAVVGVEAALDTGKLGEIAHSLRVVAFYYLVPSMGFLLLAPVAMAIGWRRRRRRPAEWSFAIACFAVFAIGAIVWGLVVFGSAEDHAVLHICSFLIPILGMAGAVAGLRAVLPRFAVYYVAVASALSLALYVPSLDPPVGTSYSILAAIVGAAALAGFGVLAFRGAGDDGEPAAEATPT